MDSNDAVFADVNILLNTIIMASCITYIIEEDCITYIN